MKKIDVVKVYSRNNEIHFVLLEHEDNKRSKNHADLSYAKVKTLMKKEAAKPLLLLRTE
jgi:hypothetical protein